MTNKSKSMKEDININYYPLPIQQKTENEILVYGLKGLTLMTSRSSISWFSLSYNLHEREQPFYFRMNGPE